MNDPRLTHTMNSGKKTTTLITTLVICSIGLCFAAVCIWGVFLSVPHNRCRAYREIPTYTNIIDESYRLLRVHDIRQPNTYDPGDPEAQPIIFLHGHCGEYSQARHVSSDYAGLLTGDLAHSLSLEYIPNFSIYTVDFNEEPSGFHAELILRQAEFVAKSIARIRTLHPGRPIWAIGHSMGGIVAKKAFIIAGVQGGIIISINTPHQQHPFPLHRSMSDLYRNLSLPHSVGIVSITGGVRDSTIRSLLCDLTDLHPTSMSLFLPTVSMQGVYMPIDHDGVLWCRQFIIVLLEGLFLAHSVADESSSVMYTLRQHWAIDLLAAVLKPPSKLNSMHEPVLTPVLEDSSGNLSLDFVESGYFDLVFTSTCDEVFPSVNNDEVTLGVYSLPEYISAIYNANDPFIDPPDTHYPKNSPLCIIRATSSYRKQFSSPVKMTFPPQTPMFYQFHSYRDVLVREDSLIQHWVFESSNPITALRLQAFYNSSAPLGFVALVVPQLEVPSEACWTRNTDDWVEFATYSRASHIVVIADPRHLVYVTAKTDWLRSVVAIARDALPDTLPSAICTTLLYSMFFPPGPDELAIIGTLVKPMRLMTLCLAGSVLSSLEMFLKSPPELITSIIVMLLIYTLAVVYNFVFDIILTLSLWLGYRVFRGALQFDRSVLLLSLIFVLLMYPVLTLYMGFAFSWLSLASSRFQERFSSDQSHWQLYLTRQRIWFYFAPLIAIRIPDLLIALHDPTILMFNLGDMLLTVPVLVCLLEFNFLGYCYGLRLDFMVRDDMVRFRIGFLLLAALSAITLRTYPYRVEYLACGVSIYLLTASYVYGNYRYTMKHRRSC